uniref:Uncharacterized protein n=1 Tax=Mycena chlorophos TaxID=658473 RepID=A0ABQ0LWH7_MYCCL|nr:predicted protein [Mycena chlorophos]
MAVMITLLPVSSRFRRSFERDEHEYRQTAMNESSLRGVVFAVSFANHDLRVSSARDEGIWSELSTVKGWSEPIHDDAEERLHHLQRSQVSADGRPVLLGTDVYEGAGMDETAMLLGDQAGLGDALQTNHEEALGRAEVGHDGRYVPSEAASVVDSKPLPIATEVKDPLVALPLQTPNSTHPLAVRTRTDTHKRRYFVRSALAATASLLISTPSIPLPAAVNAPSVDGLGYATTNVVSTRIANRECSTGNVVDIDVPGCGPPRSSLLESGSEERSESVDLSRLTGVGVGAAHDDTQEDVPCQGPAHVTYKPPSRTDPIPSHHLYPCRRNRQPPLLVANLDPFFFPSRNTIRSPDPTCEPKFNSRRRAPAPLLREAAPPS